MIIDGKQIASEILQSVTRTSDLLQNFGKTVLVITVDPNKATQSYLRVKERQAKEAGMELTVWSLPHDISTDILVAKIHEGESDALVVQLPLPNHIDTRRVLDSIPTKKDADVLSYAARMAFEQNQPGALLPPVVAAVERILDEAKVSVGGKRAVVIGEGSLVGYPVATWLRNQGAYVTTITLEFGDLAMLKDADIIVSGAGSPLLVQPHMIKEGVVLIDAGTSQVGGALLGDIDPSCAEKASVFTPVPGGVGPIAVACLFQNVLALEIAD